MNRKSQGRTASELYDRGPFHREVAMVAEAWHVVRSVRDALRWWELDEHSGVSRRVLAIGLQSAAGKLSRAARILAGTEEP